MKVEHTLAVGLPLSALLLWLGACSHNAAVGDGGSVLDGSEGGAEDATPADSMADGPIVDADPGPVGRPDASVEDRCDAYASGVRVFDVDERHPREISGLAVSRQNPGVLWVQDDGGNEPLLYALDFDGRVLGRVALAAPLSFPPFPADDADFRFNNDWEDISLGPCGDGTGAECLYIGDFGDNSGNKQDTLAGFHYTVFRVREPVIDATAVFDDMTTEDWVGLPFTYPDSGHDAEALAVDAAGGVIVLSKERERDASHVYRFASLPETAPRTFAAVQVLEALTTLALADEPLNLATGADMNRAGDRLALRTYLHVYEYELPGGFDDLADSTMRAGAVPDLAYPDQSPQGEAVAYDPFTGHLMTISENAGGGFFGMPSLHEFPCAP